MSSTKPTPTLLLAPTRPSHRFVFCHIHRQHTLRRRWVEWPERRDAGPGDAVDAFKSPDLDGISPLSTTETATTAGGMSEPMSTAPCSGQGNDTTPRFFASPADEVLPSSGDGDGSGGNGNDHGRGVNCDGGSASDSSRAYRGESIVSVLVGSAQKYNI